MKIFSFGKTIKADFIFTLTASIACVKTQTRFCKNCMLALCYYHWEQAYDLSIHCTIFATCPFHKKLGSKQWLRVHTVTFLRTMLSATSLTASIAFVYTLPSFLRKSSAQTNAKTCWENPNPLIDFLKKLQNPCQSIRDLTKIFYSCIIALKC